MFNLYNLQLQLEIELIAMPELQNTLHLPRMTFCMCIKSRSVRLKLAELERLTQSIQPIFVFLGCILSCWFIMRICSHSSAKCKHCWLTSITSIGASESMSTIFLLWHTRCTSSVVYNLCESQAGANFRYSFLNSLILPHNPIAEMTRRGTDMIFFDSNKEFFCRQHPHQNYYSD